MKHRTQSAVQHGTRVQCGASRLVPCGIAWCSAVLYSRHRPEQRNSGLHAALGSTSHKVQCSTVTQCSAMCSTVRCGTTQRTQCTAAQHTRKVRHNAHSVDQHSMRSVGAAQRAKCNSAKMHSAVHYTAHIRAAQRTRGSAARHGEHSAALQSRRRGVPQGVQSCAMQCGTTHIVQDGAGHAVHWSAAQHAHCIAAQGALCDTA